MPKPLLILDLDETLIYGTETPLDRPEDFRVEPFYIYERPGGDNILSACGVDATEYFKGEKAGQEGGKKDHSNSNEAFEHLGTLKLGELAE
jgi:hypothetical protein